MYSIWMEDYPRSVLEFRDRFLTDDDCLRYLEALRWPNGFICPCCGCREFWRTEGILFKCKNCRRRSSVTAGTIFHNTRKPLRLWFEAMWYITSQKYGANALGRPKSSLPWKLSYGVGMASSTEASDGASRKRKAFRYS